MLRCKMTSAGRYLRHGCSERAPPPPPGVDPVSAVPLRDIWRFAECFKLSRPAPTGTPALFCALRHSFRSGCMERSPLDDMTDRTTAHLRMLGSECGKRSFAAIWFLNPVVETLSRVHQRQIVARFHRRRLSAAVSVQMTCGRGRRLSSMNNRA